MKTSLDHLPQRKQQDVQTITTLLRNEFSTYLEGKSSVKANYRILKIILFGSHAKGGWVDDPANGYISDYDILLIVNDPALVEEYALWRAVEDRIQRSISTPVGLIIHTIEDISNHLHQGHYFFKDIREQGIELYSHSKKELVQPGNLTLKSRKPSQKTIFNSGLRVHPIFSSLFVSIKTGENSNKLLFCYIKQQNVSTAAPFWSVLTIGPKPTTSHSYAPFAPSRIHVISTTSPVPPNSTAAVSSA